MDQTAIKEIVTILIALFGGLGLFLYGMTMMSDGLEKSAGSRMEKVIEKMSGNVFMGVLVGTGVTAIVQSSSATTVMVVGFVNAGIMNLSQAIGIIMGANIGTTITAQLVAFELTAVAPVAIAAGTAIKLFSKKSKRKIFGEILLGFGILFLGMDIMKDAMSPLREFEGFNTLIQSISVDTFWGTVKGFAVGFAITAIVQSSSATTSILIALAATGALPIESAFPILLGTNVGTCVTAILSSIGANRNSKRAALMHLLFNFFGTVIFIIFFSDITVTAVKSMSDDPARQLANAHTIFNVANVLLLLPLSGLIVKVVKKLIPENEDEKLETYYGSKFLDDRILSTPTIALGQVSKEVLHMGEVVIKSYEYAAKALSENNLKAAQKTFKIEKSVNQLEREISEYLVKLSNESVGDDDRAIIDSLFSTVNDIERIGDHADNLAELGIYKIENDIRFSDKASIEIKEMIEHVEKSVILALGALRDTDYKMAEEVISIEASTDEMEKSFRKKHIRRLNEGKCETNSGIIFLDAISNLERITDHSKNIAEAVLAIK